MARKMWGGRFSKKADQRVMEFTRSISYDYRLAEYDIIGSISHVEVLRKAGYLTPAEASRLTKGLQSIFDAIKKGRFTPDEKQEDIHTQIQNLLEKRLGSVVKKLHTGRSRNDQVVFATKLFCKMHLFKVQSGIRDVAQALSRLARKNRDVIIPGFTHLQHAQPVFLRDYLVAYLEMLERDSARLNFISKTMRVTLGAGAVAGTPIPSSRYRVDAGEILKGYAGITELFEISAPTNSLDAVSDRDFVIETIAALSLLGMHLSRFAEDLIIWSTREFGFVELDDAYCTGSSLMPQKKNPDVLELIRGYAGRLCGNLVSVLMMMKALPLAYNRDMQLDKEPLFSSFDIIDAELGVLSGLVATLTFNRQRIRDQLKDESLYATDLVYYLVEKGVPFTSAHEIIGKLVRFSLKEGIHIVDMPEAALKAFSPRFVKRELVRLFDPSVSVKSKKSVRR